MKKSKHGQNGKARFCSPINIFARQTGRSSKHNEVGFDFVPKHLLLLSATASLI